MKHKDRRIIVGIDLNDRSPPGMMRARSLIRFAEELEQMTGLSPHIVFAARAEDQATHGHDGDADRPSMEQQFQELTKGRRWQTTVLSGRPEEAIPGLAKERNHPVELFVVGMRELNTLQRVYPGSVTEEMVRLSQRPLAILGPNATRATTSANFFRKDKPLRLLVSTDLGRHSRCAEHYALSLARRTNASITLLHNTREIYRSIEESVIQSGMVPVEFEEIHENMVKSAQKLLQEKRGFMERRGVRCEYVLDSETLSASDSILDRQDDHSMIVMGNRGRDRLMSLLFGSMLHRTLEGATVPVLAIRG